ncbi:MULTISPECIES: DUF1127 domain-containing protein [Agrobacterium]|uniref:DUF1127 domain-containing protein n=1 Tax=Agrobacterium TaxID=357 RepID=UPI00097D6248
MIFCIWPDRHRQRRALLEMDNDKLDDFGISESASMQKDASHFGADRLVVEFPVFFRIDRCPWIRLS